jgi:hypothetical protein
MQTDAHHIFMLKDLTPEITDAIRCVLEKFGVHFLSQEDQDPIGKEVIRIDLKNTQQVNRILKSRGADIHLLCTIGSWRDTVSDEEVLRDLRHWLRNSKALLPAHRAS